MANADLLIAYWNDALARTWEATSEAAVTAFLKDRPPFGADDGDHQDRRRFKSPTASIKANNHERTPSPIKRSQGQATRDEDPFDLLQSAASTAEGLSWPPFSRSTADVTDSMRKTRPRVKQPETRPISQEQLVAEVKGIYAELVTVESKYIEVDDAQHAGIENATKLDNDKRWSAPTTRRAHALLDNPIARATGSRVKPGAGLIRERRYLEVVINEKVQYALPDTGVRENVITREHALSLGATIDSSHERRFMNAQGRAFRSIGTTKLQLSFTDDPTKKLTCNFDVVETLAVPLVLGNRFLEITRTLKEYTHRLIKKTLSFIPGLGNKKIFTFMHMDSPRQKLGCHLDAELIFADVDSGSHLNFVSPDLVELHGWEVFPLTDEEAWVMLADGEMVRLEGYVETTLGIRGGCIKERFYVLDGLTCGAVIGDSTIESLDLFNKFSDSLIDLDLVQERDNFHNIAWVDTGSVLDDIEEETDRLLTSYNKKYNNAATTSHGWRRLLPRSGTQDKHKAHDTRVIIDHIRKRLGNLDKTWGNFDDQYNNEMSSDEQHIHRTKYSDTKQHYDRVRQTLTDQLAILREPR